MIYDKNFYDDQQVGSYRSAQQVVPFIFEILNPKSVLDVGCGVGTWLSVCMENGVNDIVGIDGDYVDKNRLQIPSKYFNSKDLTNYFDLNRSFDLVLCLEVAEHLPESSAQILVENLVHHGKAILFSAALPGQGGKYHINEQLTSFWMKLFQKYDYHFFDVVRPSIYDNANVEIWYRQNCFFVCSMEVATSLDLKHPGSMQSDLKVYRKLLEYEQIVQGRAGWRKGFSAFYKALANSFYNKLGR